MTEGSPLNDIMQMRQQGLSNNQIIQNLQRTGYSNTQIFDAMNQADAKTAVEGGQQPMQQVQEQLPPQPETQPVEPQQPQKPLFSEAPPIEASEAPDQDYPLQDNQVQVEELIETVIEEKWNDLIKDVNKIVEWKNKVESRISDMEIKLNSLKDSFSDLNQAILGKITDYDKHIMEVGSDIKAMEKVFSKVLPGFTENVNELSRIANKIKGKSSTKEQTPKEGDTK